MRAFHWLAGRRLRSVCIVLPFQLLRLRNLWVVLAVVGVMGWRDQRGSPATPSTLSHLCGVFSPRHSCLAPLTLGATMAALPVFMRRTLVPLLAGLGGVNSLRLRLGVGLISSPRL